LADAAATAICNAVHGKDIKASVQQGLDFAATIDIIRGALIIRGKYAGSVGKIARFVKMETELDINRVSLSKAFPSDMLFL